LASCDDDFDPALIFVLASGVSLFGHVSHGANPARARHRATLVHPETEEVIEDLLISRTYKPNPVVYTEVLELIWIKSQIGDSLVQLRPIIWLVDLFCGPAF
jgi:hypothetical protein